MTRRNQRRTGLAALFVAGVLGSALAVTTPASAQAAGPVTGTVSTGGMALNVRTGPSANTTRVGSIKEGTRVTIVCHVKGQRVAGSQRTTDVWDRLSSGRYISDAYVKRTAVIPPCPAAPARPVARKSGWVAPVPAKVGSTFRSAHRPTHDGVDLSAERNTSIRAVAAGTVIRVVCNASTGNCNVDGSPKISGCGWYVEILHAGKIVTRYCHMVKQPRVREGQRVTAGQVIGYVGSSGRSSGPHLHFEVHVNAPPANRTNAVNPVPFMKARGVNLV